EERSCRYDACRALRSTACSSTHVSCDCFSFFAIRSNTSSTRVAHLAPGKPLSSVYGRDAQSNKERNDPYHLGDPMTTRCASRFAAIIAFIFGISLSAPALSQNAPAADQGKVIGLGFVGRTVADLDRSIAYYKAIGFKQDPAANSVWRRDE